MQVKSCDILMYFVDVTHVSILESADMSQLRQLYYTLPSCFCPDPFVTPEGYEKNGTVWQCAKGYAGDAELLCQERGCLMLEAC
jgi:hypothetical protein